MDFQFEKISVILPLYNAEEFIEQAICSIIDQGEIVKEIIIVDDGSIDNSYSIAKCISKVDSRIQVISTDNRGPSHARNIGIKASTSTRVFFADADDLLVSNALHLLSEMMFKHKSDICIGIHSQLVFFKNSWKSIVNDCGIIHDQLMGSQDIYSYLKKYCLYPRNYSLFEHCWNRIYKKNIIINNGLQFPENINQLEDIYFNFKYLKFCKRISVLHTSTYQHRIHTSPTRLSNISGQDLNSVNNTLFGLAPVADLLSLLESNQTDKNVNYQHFILSLRGAKVLNHLARICLSAKICHIKNSLDFVNSIKENLIFRQSLSRIRLASDESRLLLLLVRLNAPSLILIIYMNARKLFRRMRQAITV